jgi:hypothetical protein
MTTATVITDTAPTDTAPTVSPSFGSTGTGGKRLAGALDVRDPKDRAELAKELRRQLVADTSTPEHMLAFTAHFARLREAGRRAGIAGVVRSYSSSNLALLMLQERRFEESHRGLYAGSSQWLSLGREVRGTARPKYVWAPSVTAAKQDDNSTSPTKKVAKPSFVRFVAVEVFDYTDTVSVDGEPDPDWARPVSFGSRQVLNALVSGSPVPVRFNTLGSGAAHGFTNGTEIVVGADLSVGQQISTVCHELGHVLLGHIDRIAREGAAVRPGCEQEAELTAYLTLSALGLVAEAGTDLTANVVDYLRSWDADGKNLEGHKQREKLLYTRIERAWEAAEQILASTGL